MALPEITVRGRVVNAPRRTRFDESDTSVTNFRIAATDRKIDRSTGEWVDGETFWTDVECWDELSGNVAHSLSKGDPVVVVGKVWTRDYETPNGRGSTSRIRAHAVALDLRHGWAELKKAARPARAEEPAALEGAGTGAPDVLGLGPSDLAYVTSESSSESSSESLAESSSEVGEPAFAG